MKIYNKSIDERNVELFIDDNEKSTPIDYHSEDVDDETLPFF
jgi:hypothetical protein